MANLEWVCWDRIIEGQPERDWIEEDTSPFEGLKRPFNSDRDYRDSAPNRENEKSRLKLLDLSVWAPRPFGEDENRNALLEEICRLSQTFQCLAGIFSIKRNLARPREDQAQEGN